MFTKFSQQHIPSSIQRPVNDGRVGLPLRDIQSLALKHGGKPALGKGMEISKKELMKLYLLALQHKQGGELPQEQIASAAHHATAKLRTSVTKLVNDPLVPEHRKVVLQETLLAGQTHSHDSIMEWCKQMAHSDTLTTLQPVLEGLNAVVESGAMPESPTKDSNVVGKATEAKVLPMLMAGLPGGWSIMDGVNLSKIDGKQHPPAEGIKAEFDAVVVDQQGHVQYLVEVKTAKNNPLAVMFEDYPKLSAAVEAVRGQSIEVTKCGPGKVKTTSTVSVASDVRVVYIIGSLLTPESAEVACRVVRAVRVGKQLSWDVGLWPQLSWGEVKGDYVTLGVPPGILDESDDELSDMLGRLREEVWVFSTVQQQPLTA